MFVVLDRSRRVHRAWDTDGWGGQFKGSTRTNWSLNTATLSESSGPGNLVPMGGLDGKNKGPGSFVYLTKFAVSNVLISLISEPVNHTWLATNSAHG
jgi:hypothetical protein